MSHTQLATTKANVSLNVAKAVTHMLSSWNDQCAFFVLQERMLSQLPNEGIFIGLEPLLTLIESIGGKCM